MIKITLNMQYDIVNRNGDEVCHAVKCRKHTKLNIAYNGKFCKYHLSVLTSIRESLIYSKKTKNIYLENYYRQREIELRKFPEKNHMKYKVKLEDYLSL